MAAATAAGELVDQAAHVSATRSDGPPAGAPAHHMKGGKFDNPWPTWEVQRPHLLFVLIRLCIPYVGVWYNILDLVAMVCSSKVTDIGAMC
jgi:hypothetical protein